MTVLKKIFYWEIFVLSDLSSPVNLGIILLGLILGIFLGNKISKRRDKDSYVAIAVVWVILHASILMTHCCPGKLFMGYIGHLGIFTPLGSLSTFVVIGMLLAHIFNLLRNNSN